MMVLIKKADYKRLVSILIFLVLYVFFHEIGHFVVGIFFGLEPSFGININFFNFGFYVHMNNPVHDIAIVTLVASGGFFGLIIIPMVFLYNKQVGTIFLFVTAFYSFSEVIGHTSLFFVGFSQLFLRILSSIISLLPVLYYYIKFVLKKEKETK